MTAAAAPHAPLAFGAVAAGQGAPPEPLGCTGGSPLPCSSWNCRGIQDEPGGGSLSPAFRFGSLPRSFFGFSLVVLEMLIYEIHVWVVRSYGFIRALPYRLFSHQPLPPTWFTGVLCLHELSSGCRRQVWSPRFPDLGLLPCAGKRSSRAEASLPGLWRFLLCVLSSAPDEEGLWGRERHNREVVGLSV